MDDKAKIINIVKAFASAVNQTYPLKQTVIFGSQVKGTALPYSDIDVCLVSEHFPEPVQAIRLKLEKVSKQYDDRIEVHPMRPEDYNNRFYTFAREIKTHGIVVS